MATSFRTPVTAPVPSSSKSVALDNIEVSLTPSEAFAPGTEVSSPFATPPLPPPTRPTPTRRTKKTINKKTMTTAVVQAASIAVDTRVILGGLLAWGIVGQVVRMLRTKKNASTFDDVSQADQDQEATKNEIESLRSSLKALRADNDLLAAQVYQLRAGLAKVGTFGNSPTSLLLVGSHHQNFSGTIGTGPGPGGSGSGPPTKALSDAFERAADAPCGSSNTSIDNFPFAAEFARLQEENEQLHQTLQLARQENTELGERLLEMAFTATEVASQEESTLMASSPSHTPSPTTLRRTSPEADRSSASVVGTVWDGTYQAVVPVAGRSVEVKAEWNQTGELSYSMMTPNTPGMVAESARGTSIASSKIVNRPHIPAAQYLEE